MSNITQLFPGRGQPGRPHAEKPKSTFEPNHLKRERLASRDRKQVQVDIDCHIAARFAYGQALARVQAIEDGNLPTAQIADAHLKAYEAYAKMTEAARQLLIVMPTDLKALVDLLLYLEKNFSLLPPEIATGVSNGQTLAFTLLQTVRLSLRRIAKYGKGKCDGQSDEEEQ
ncbi:MULTISPECIES: hypothetical protein [Bradyrhizobium]|uniref:hypothetical protein n=1 Tax=Bradyrhizobium TaxID=374 RepID=UPI001EDB75BD|nr:hypothetical protein [Bradyrhizobium zhengyangense]MCG2639671.1 hypothetical protein [Bradyrhizobium zhengyangense]